MQIRPPPIERKTIDSDQLQKELKTLSLSANENGYPNLNGITLVFQCIDDKRIWRRVGKKTDGANEAGEHGGFYELIVNPKVRVFFKQDPVIAKNISEYIASSVMRSIAGEIGFIPNAIAQVELAYVKSTDKANRDGNNVYVASVIYPDFLELYKDAYLAFYFLPQYQELRDANPKLANRLFPKERPKLFGSDDIVNLMIESGRYHGLNPLLHLSRSVDDPDVHLGNIGVVPGDANVNQNEPPITVEISADGRMTPIDNPKALVSPGCKRLTVFPKVDAVRIDFGAAFGDDRFIRRTYDQNDLNKGLIATLIAYHPSKEGPPPYVLKIPSLVRNDPSSLYWLDKIANCTEKCVRDAFTEAVTKAFEKYERKPLLEFAHLIGLKFKKDRAKDISDEELRNDIIEFLTNCFTNFQASAQTYKSKLGQRKGQEEEQNVENNSKKPINAVGTKTISQVKVDIFAKIIDLLCRINPFMEGETIEDSQSTLQTLIKLREKLHGLLDDQILTHADEFMYTLETMEKLIREKEIEREKSILEALIEKLIRTKEIEKEKQILKASDANLINSIALLKFAEGKSNASLALLQLFNASVSTLSQESHIAKSVRKFFKKSLSICLARDASNTIDSDEEIQLITIQMKQLTEVLSSLEKYKDELADAKHASLELNGKGKKLFQKRVEQLDFLLLQLAEGKYADFERLKRRIDESTKLVKEINILKKEIDKARVVHPVQAIAMAENRVAARTKSFYEESCKSASKLLAEDVPNLNDTKLLTDTVGVVSDGVRNPMEADVARLKINSKELEGKSSFTKKLAGAGFLVAGALTAVAATVLLVGSLALAKPSFLLSLFGIPVSYKLYGVAGGFFATGAGLLFSGRQKSTSKATSKVAESFEKLKVEAQESLGPRAIL